MSVKRIKQTDAANMDANDVIFFEKELESLESVVYEVRKEEFTARSVFPIDSSDGEGAETLVYQMSEGASPDAVILAPGATHVPRSDIKMKEFVSKVVRIGAGYGYNDDEIAAARFAGKSLEQLRAVEARRMIARKENDLAWFGDDAAGIVGFLLNGAIPRIGAPNGVGGSPLWSNKTALEILDDLFTLCNNSMSLTKEVEVPDTLLLPPAQYRMLTQEQTGTENAMSILARFRQGCPWITNIAPVTTLASAINSQNVAVAYRRDPSVLSLKVPMPLRQMAPFRESFQSWLIALKQKQGPVVVRYPLAITFLQGI